MLNKCYAGVCRIDEWNKQKYIDLHREIPIEIKQLIENCNIRNYRIFIKDELLFTYYEYIGKNHEEDMIKMEKNQDNREWWELVKPLMKPLTTRKDGEFWAEMEQIFHQD